MKATDISIVDRGRGVQLSTGRVTVQDFVPYFQTGCSYGEIMRWIPSLSEEEIVVAEAYYRDHREELDEEDRRMKAYRQEQIRGQQDRFPEEERKVRLERMKRLVSERRQETDGARNPG